MEKLFDKLPYDDLEGVQFTHLLAGAIGAGLLLFVIYFFTLYSATHTEFELLVKEKEVAERTLKRYKATVAKKEWVAKNLARIRGQFDAYKKQMPDQNEIPNLVQKIATFGKYRNIEMVALTLGEGAVGDFYKEIPLNVHIFGDLWVMLDFIEYMQNLLRLVSFDNMALQGLNPERKKSGGARSVIPGSVNMTFTAKTYSYLEGAENKLGEKKKKGKK